MGVSSLNRNWSKAQQAPPENWMSLKEYLDICRTAELRPLIGVNYNCHNYQKCNVPRNESIARAVRQVEYVVQAGFSGAFWYIGNEDGAPQHAELIVAHARAMKQVDPTLKAFWNDNDLSPDHLTAFLKTAGEVMDGAEFHGKWPYGGKPKNMPAFSVQDYLNEVPLIEHKSGQTWREKIGELRRTARALGRPDFLFANNEYGLGGNSPFAGNWSRFTKSLVAVEFALEMYIAGYDLACFWDNGDGYTGSNPSLPQPSAGYSGGGHMLLESTAGFRMNTMHLGFEMLAQAQNRSYLKLNTSAARVHGFATIAESTAPTGTGGALLQIFLINKYDALQDVQVTLPSTLAWRALDPSGLEIRSMVDTADHWGQRTMPTPVSCNSARALCECTLPPLSFSVIQ
jgi:hypothetical protein